MTSAESELQMAIHALLTGDINLTEMLGGPHVYDEAPARLKLPLVILGPVTTLDWGSSDSVGDEIEITIEIWSSKRGKVEAMNIAARIRELLETMTFDGSDHRLVLIHFVSNDISYDEQANAFLGQMHFRALIESTA